MKIAMEKKKAEAIRRMKKLGICKQTIEQFEEDGKVSVSEPPLGGLYWVDKEDDLPFIKDFETKTDGLVYLVVRSFTNLGIMDSILFVSDEEDEWKEDNEAMEDGIIFAYVRNKTYPECSEYGDIRVKKVPSASILRVL